MPIILAYINTHIRQLYASTLLSRKSKGTSVLQSELNSDFCNQEVGLYHAGHKEYGPLPRCSLGINGEVKKGREIVA